MGEGADGEMNPIVSVVMAVYNSQSFLAQSVGTILSQTLDTFELILVDDGSKDNSLNILYEFQEKDSRIRVISQKNQGAGVARNSGLSIAKGKYILFLDSDDYFEADMLKIMVGKAEETHADVTICRAICFDHQTGKALPSDWLRKDKFLDRVDGRTTFAPEEMKDCLFQFTYGWAWDKLFRLDFVRERGMKFPNLRHSEDLVFVYMAISLARNITIVNEALVHYRMKRQNSISNTREKELDDLWVSMDLFEHELKSKNIYDIFQQSFLNWAMEFCVWNVSHLNACKNQKAAYNFVKKKRLSIYKFNQYPRDYFRDNLTYYKYILVKCSPFFIFFYVVNIYRKWRGDLK